MELYSEHALTALIMLAGMGLCFGLLALVVKRGAIFAAIASCRREFATNLGLMMINLIVLAPLFLVPEGAIRSQIGAPAAFITFWDGLYAPLTLATAIMLYDFAVYWRHRAEHLPLLWPIHATHHADTQMNWLTVMRKHPFSRLLSICIDVWILLLLGIPEWAVGAATLVRSWWGFFIHCDVPWTLGAFGKVLISPAAHRLHHIRDEALMGSNYGNTVTLWDRVFGTYVDPKPYLNCETGIAEGTRGLAGELMRPFERRYWRKAEAGPVEGEVAA